MQNLKITRYTNPLSTGWSAYLEPEDRSWILYVGLDGRPIIYPHRDPVSGAILPADPSEHAAHLAYLRAEGASGHTGQLQPDGQRVYPLGIDGTGGVGLRSL